MDLTKIPLKKKVFSHDSLEIGWFGAPLEEGPLEAVFYLALSLEDTLLKEPFNTPAKLAPSSCRFFSVGLPFHKESQNEQNTLSKWLEEELIEPFIDSFLEKLAQTILHLKHYCTKIHFVGLSRGAWIAMQVCEKLKKRDLSIHSLILFAPLCDFSLVGKEVPSSFASCLNLDFSNQKLWISISCLDSRVDTEKTLSLFAKQQQYDPKGLREHRLILYPAIGYKGHGTPNSIFQEGMAWLSSCC